MKKLIMTLSLLPMASFADTKVIIDVNGLICDFCAQAVEKVFVGEHGAHHADVNLDTGIVTLCFPDDAKLMSDEEFFKEMTAAGYTATGIRKEKGECDETDQH